MVHRQILQQLHRYHSAGLCIRKGVMVVHEVISAGCGDGLELMVGEPAAEVTSGSRQGVVELIVGVVHLIYLEDSLETSFIETGVVRNEREALDERFNLLPDVWEYRCIFSVFRPKSVNPLAKPLVVLRLGVDETVEGVHNLPVTHDHHSDGAYAGGLLVRRLEIYCCKICHNLQIKFVFLTKIRKIVVICQVSGGQTIF